MFSVASLLNPAPKEPRIGLPSSPSSSSHCTTPSSTYGTPPPSTRPNPIFKQKMTKDGAVFVKGKTKGDVNYSPFDRLDEDSTREVQRFQVKPFGAIGEYARHIPYNSEKKSFLEKTGRESFEVFQYEFKVPGDEKVYTVMWDYNIGLVRITPFFKCCKYSKTTPAKMLNMNPGLKEITHSITGGALVAQGYWMPYSCALAVCTTFCARIAGALIPIFGPKFPSQCVPPEAPEHGRMIIDSSLVINATAQAERYRQQYSSYIPSGKSCSSRDSYSPQQRVHERSPLPNTRQTPDMHLSKRLRLKRAFTGDSPTSDTDFDRAGSETSGEGYFTPSTPSPTLMHQQSYRHQNAISHSANSSINFNISPIHAHQTQGPNPLLSAIPRSTDFNDMNAVGSRIGTWRQAKRRADEVDADDEAEYEGEESTTASIADDKASVDADANTSNDNDNDKEMEDVVPGGVEKKAAYLLMNLNIKDRESASASASANPAAKKDGGPRVKRLRATSM